MPSCASSSSTTAETTAAASSSAAAATAAALSQLDQLQFYNMLFLAGALIIHCVIERQKQQVLCAAQGKTVTDDCILPLRQLSNMMTLCALIFFFQLSQQEAKTCADSEIKNTSNRANFWAGGLALSAGIIRLWDLLCLQDTGIEADTII